MVAKSGYREFRHTPSSDLNVAAVLAAATLNR